MAFYLFSGFGPKVWAGVLQEDVRGLEDLQEIVRGPVVLMNQVHGTEIVEVGGGLVAGEELPTCDALVTRQKGLTLIVKSADCIPLVMADEEAGLAAAVHAGWRGLTADIIPKTISRLVEMGAQVERIRVGIGPSLGFECSDFSDPFKEIPEKYHWAVEAADVAGQGRVNLNAICDRQLLEAGILPEHVKRMDICTKCSADWFSVRRDGDPRRFGTMVKLME